MTIRARMFALGAVLCVLAGCAPVSVFYRPGADGARTQFQTDQCRVTALRDAPVANQIRQYPPIFYPGTRFCDAAGNCAYSPGYWVDGGFETVDVNAPLRARLTTDCMARQGYQLISLKRCDRSVAASQPPIPNAKLPPVTQASCVVVLPSGRWRIVTPGA
ncbi:hypothetical protein [Chachezhania antarctica]|uniref:hypothetical protein n=1 Tax=Chachezhania antarctica TaxID=2340860 RepID=UPI001F0A00EB|nr:hypothetical protein [Chachezhania antarctica]|tara:strand:- start:4510 stop:4992 length:483 start_codon:yes stop_codon:yes gene_type:complete